MHDPIFMEDLSFIRCTFERFLFPIAIFCRLYTRVNQKHQNDYVVFFDFFPNSLSRRQLHFV